MPGSPCATRARLQHVALNVAKFVNMRSDGVLRADVMGSDVIGIDGMGILLALRLFGVPCRERVTGIDLCWEFSALRRRRLPAVPSRRYARRFEPEAADVD